QRFCNRRADFTLADDWSNIINKLPMYDGTSELPREHRPSSIEHPPLSRGCCRHAAQHPNFRENIGPVRSNIPLCHADVADMRRNIRTSARTSAPFDRTSPFVTRMLPTCDATSQLPRGNPERSIEHPPLS